MPPSLCKIWFRVDGALQKTGSARLCCLALKDPGKAFPDRLALLFGIGDPGKRCNQLVTGIDHLEPDIPKDVFIRSVSPLRMRPVCI